MIWLRTLFLIGLWSVIALLVGLTAGAATAWALLSIALAGHLLWRSHRLQRVATWAADPTQPPPAAVGQWDDVLAPLYRYTRAQTRDLNSAREAMQSMLAAAQALPDGAVTLNSELQIDWCNRMAREHLGLKLPADRGHNLLNLVRSPEFAAYARQDDWPEPTLVRMPHGQDERLLMVQLTAYARDQRLLISRDVTQIEKLETTRRDFVANVSHELRTPLTVLSGFLETMASMPAEALPEAQRQHYMDLMLEQAARMQAIVADLLTLSTLESSPSADPQPVAMEAMLGGVRLQIEALSNGRHTFDWHVEPELDLLGAETELSSAFSNLLTNAVRYTPDGGTITVSWTREEDGGARYTVQDTGIGIAKRHLPRLTERFYRVDWGRSRAVGGTGLGLAITRHIALRHGADIHVESEPGRGSIFTLTFPAERVAEQEDRVN